MPAKLLALCLALAACLSAQTPKLLLTPQRLKRLQRDRERQTDRWLNFEQRVKTVPDSPERGFELALYYAVSGDEQRGRQAIQWALAHQCKVRQVALVRDWTAPLMTEAERQQFGTHACPNYHPGAFTQLRDTYFMKRALDQESNEGSGDSGEPGLSDPEELYAAIELSVAERNRGGFSDVAAKYLLSFAPAELEHPTWLKHIIALALVSLKPNAQESQFLQGWAMEDRFTLREGPGVAYEFLWADPYLPGISYQNMDPWLYDDKGLLIARGGWSQLACWIEVSSSGTHQQNCPPNWESQTVFFGHLTLIPVTEKCVQIEREDRNEGIILWKLNPHEKLTYTVSGANRSVEADAAGMWRVPAEARGKVCAHK
ncbi:MAG: hypothetical protein M3Y57_14555 [Acidobacteriota bacterium]|nr:hypothetical protein [Acidobacteriota bacterium]